MAVRARAPRRTVRAYQFTRPGVRRPANRGASSALRSSPRAGRSSASTRQRSCATDSGTMRRRSKRSRNVASSRSASPPPITQVRKKAVECIDTQAPVLGRLRSVVGHGDHRRGATFSARDSAGQPRRQALARRSDGQGAVVEAVISGRAAGVPLRRLGFDNRVRPHGIEIQPRSGIGDDKAEFLAGGLSPENVAGPPSTS